LSLGAFLLFSLSAAADSPPAEVGTPFHIGGEPVFGPVRAAALSPSIAFDGENHLVVWNEWIDDGWRIRGNRVSSAGEVLDIPSIAISNRPVHQMSPEVVFDGSNFVAAWREVPVDEAERDTTPREIRCARISPDGTIMDPESILVSIIGDQGAAPQMACSDSSCMIVWSDQNLCRIAACRISEDGTALDPEPLQIFKGGQGWASIAFDGENHLVVWTVSRGRSGADIVATRVTPHGDVLDVPFFAVTDKEGYELEPVVAFDGTDYVVAWLDTGGTERKGYEVLATRISPDAEVQNKLGVPVSSGIRPRGDLEIFSSTANSLVTWGDTHEDDLFGVSAARISPSLEPLDPDPIVLSREAHGSWDSGVSFDGSNYAVTLQQKGTKYGSRIIASWITLEGEVIDPAGVPQGWGANAQKYPAAAYDGQRYLAVWLDESWGDVDLAARLVDPSGTASGEDRFLLAEADSTDYRFRPSVSSNGSGFLVAAEAWNPGIYGRRRIEPDIHLIPVSVNGTPAGETPVVLTSNEMPDIGPELASNGVDYMVVWEEAYEFHSSAYIGDYYVYRPVATRVNGSCEVLDVEPIRLPGKLTNMTVEYGGGCYLVAGFDGDIAGVRVSSSGQVLDSSEFTISQADYLGTYPDIAFDGTNFLVVWTDDVRGSYSNITDVYGARVTPDGHVLDAGGFTVCNAPGDQSGASVTYDGTYFVVVWLDERNGGRELYGARVTAGGELIDQGGFPVATGTERNGWPRTAASPPGQFLTVYQQFVPDPPFGADRIWATFWNRVDYSRSVDITVTPSLMESSTRIGFNLPSHTKIRLNVFDAAGRRVKEVARGYRPPGWSYEVWDGTGERGTAVPDGVYFARIECGLGTASAKFIVAK
jgi:hypothetical protein